MNHKHLTHFENSENMSSDILQTDPDSDSDLHRQTANKCSFPKRSHAS